MAQSEKKQTQQKSDAANENAKPVRRRTDDASILIDENGQTAIYQQVVAKIAGIAVREIEGVHRLVPFGAGQQVASLARSVSGAEMRDLGVHVEVGTKETAVDVRIVTEYGVSIPSVADAVRRNVAERVEGMTGLKVVEVNIDVLDLFFAEDEEEQAPEASRVQ